MTYNATEISVESGRPLEIFTWARSTQLWRDTSADRDVVVASNTYTARPMSRGNIEQGGELNRSGLQVVVPRDHPVAVLYRITPPNDIILLTLQQYHEGDGAVQIVWSGRVLAVSHSESTSEINLEPIATSIRRIGLRRLYQASCPHVLYGAPCGLAAATYRSDKTVSAISGLTVTATGLNAQPDGYWEGGYIKYDIGAGIYEHRFIEGHTGNTITLDLPLIGLAVSASMQVYPGCDHTITTCQSKFANQLNFGGMPYFPKKNPFGSDPVY